MTQPKIFVLLKPSLYAELFSPQSDQMLRTLGQLIFTLLKPI